MKTRALTGIDPFAGKITGRQLAEPQDALSLLQGQIIEAEIDQALTAAQVGAEEEMLKKQTFEVSASEVEDRIQMMPEVAALKKRIRGCQAQPRMTFMPHTKGTLTTLRSLTVLP